jgi:hypothetical protein
MKQSAAEMKAIMDATGLKYMLDESGVAVCSIGGLGPDQDRSQVVFIQNFLDRAGSFTNRDVVTKIAEASDIPKSFELMWKLLERVGSANAGALFVSGESLQWRIDVPVSATGEELNAAIFLCAELADDFETILTSGKDAY